MSKRKVRRPAAAPAHDEKERGGLARHLEGWQPAAIALLLAGSTAAIAVPRSVAPVDVPEPRVDPQALDRAAQADDALAAVADKGLDVDVLHLGGALFVFGEAESDGDAVALAKARDKALQASIEALRVGTDPVLALRAHHLRSFLREIARWEATGEESPKLQQVGGGFLRELHRNGWLEDRVGRRRVLVDRAALRVLFKKRWNKVADLRGEPFEPTVDETRALYRFFLLHPIPPPTPSGDEAPAWSGVGSAFVGQYRLKKIEELAAVDPTYPIELARGVVLYQLGRYPLAAKAFQGHLEAHPDGPYALRTQNYLRAALGRALEEQ